MKYKIGDRIVVNGKGGSKGKIAKIADNKYGVDWGHGGISTYGFSTLDGATKLGNTWKGAKREVQSWR